MTSFEFKWNKTKDKRRAGTILAKKKKPIEKNVGDLSVIATNQIKKVKILKKEKQPLKEKANGPPKIFKSNDNSISTNFIKRKNKKEKLANAQNPEYVNEVKATNTQNSGSNQHSLFSEKYKNVYINANIKGKSVVEKVFSSGKKFSDINLHKHLVSNLEKHNFNILTNVQEKSLPSVLDGENVLIRSQTGSGKTLVYAVPILNTLVNLTPKLKRSNGVQALIVVPTRELALQTHELFTKLNTFQWIVTGHLCGGENRNTEKSRLRKGVHILIGTPGRLLDHMLHTCAFNAKQVRCLVLDEADRLLDMGFKKDIVRLVEELNSQNESLSYDPMALLRTGGEKKLFEDHLTDSQSSSKKNDRQTLLLSATLTKDIAELAKFTMENHVYIDALDEFSTTNPDHLIIPNTVKQEFILTFVKHRLVLLSALLVSKSKQTSKTFVFMATGHMVDFHYDLFKKYLLRMPKHKGQMKVGDVLLMNDIELDDSDEEEELLDIELFRLHGSMNQAERKEVFNGFRKAKKGVLLCTDVAARGLDVPEADCIVQYTGPQSDDDYLHRVGRTGRAGKSGSSILFLTHEEQEYVTRLQEHKVFLKEHKADNLLKGLAEFLDQPDNEKATLAMQRRYETAIKKDKEMHKKACFAYSSWSRFYSSFPNKLKQIFDFKKVNLGHYVTSFALQETPTFVAKIVRGQVTQVEPKKLNKKLANHEDNEEVRKPSQKRKINSRSITTSEFSSGLGPVKKKRKKNLDK